jgi:ABC-type multidrug transport system ATPase subunit
MTAVPIASTSAPISGRTRPDDEGLPTREWLRVVAGDFDKTYRGPSGRIGKLLFQRATDGWFVTDVGVQGGVFLGGCRMERLPLFAGRPTEVRIGGIDGHLVRFEVVTTQLPRVEPVALVAKNLYVRAADGTTLVRNATLEIETGTLTAVIGPSGAGKSTLLRALAGQQQVASGRVTWRGADLLGDADLKRSQVGLVPQEEILHPQLAVRPSLDFAARLRLPSTSKAKDRRDAVQRVLEQLDLTERADIRIRDLSGGQRKRVSIASELLTAPPLLFLDEPTSGLDPGLDRSVMEHLRALADGDRAVVVATHSVMGLDVCDLVVAVGRGGVVAYVGPPDQLLEHFPVADHPALFALLASGSVEAAKPVPLTDRKRTRHVTTPGPASLRQGLTLIARSVAVIRADRLNSSLLVLLPLVLALLSRVVPGTAGFSLVRSRTSGGLLDSTEAGQRLAVLVIAAALLGTAMSVRELVKERAIWRREYAVGVSPAIYFASKVIVLGSICFVQGVAMAWLSMVGLPEPDHRGILGVGRWEVALIVGLLAAVMAVGGLLVSALVGSTDQVMPALVAIVMSQVVLSGAFIHVAGRPLLEQIAWLSPARWADAGASVSTGLARATAGVRHLAADPLIVASRQQWWIDVAVLAGLGVVMAIAGLRAVRSGAEEW